MIETPDPNDIFDQIIRRDDQLRRHAPSCPFCFGHQVQIMDKAKPAKWRCRICWKRFVFEPPEDPHDLPVVSGRGGKKG